MGVDTLTGIKGFRQVVESGSFAAAADRLDLSPAMASKLPGLSCLPPSEPGPRLPIRQGKRKSHEAAVVERPHRAIPDREPRPVHAVTKGA